MEFSPRCFSFQVLKKAEMVTIHWSWWTLMWMIFGILSFKHGHFHPNLANMESKSSSQGERHFDYYHRGLSNPTENDSLPPQPKFSHVSIIHWQRPSWILLGNNVLKLVKIETECPLQYNKMNKHTVLDICRTHIHNFIIFCHKNQLEQGVQVLFSLNFDDIMSTHTHTHTHH